MLEAGGHQVLVGGNIGHALSAQVDASTADTIHVVEASSFQLESVETFRPWIAVLLNFSPDHLDRHATRRGVRGGEGADLRATSTPTTGPCSTPTTRRRWRSAAARAPARLLFSMPRPAGGGHRSIAGRDRAARPRRASEPLVPLSSVQLLGPASAGRRPGGGGGGVARRRRRRGDDAGGRRLHRPRARARTGHRDRRRPVRQRLEGDQRRGGAPRHRELRPRRRRRSWAAGSRAATFAISRAPLVERGATVVAIGEARPLIREALAASRAGARRRRR